MGGGSWGQWVTSFRVHVAHIGPLWPSGRALVVQPFLDVTGSQMMLSPFPAVQVEQDPWESHSGGHRASLKP